MPEPAFDTLEAARRLESAGIDSEPAEAIVEVMGQSVNQLVTREHFDLTVEHFDLTIERFDLTVERFDAAIATLNAKIDTRVQSLEATLRAEMMRAVLIVVGILIPAIGLMMAIVQFYSSRGGGA